MRKFVSNGNQNNAKAPVSRRKKKKNSESSDGNASVKLSKSSSEPALNQPQEAFVREAAPKKTPRKKSGLIKKKNRNSVLPSTPSLSSSLSSPNINGPNAPREPVFAVDIKTQNTRLVTPRQRQEIFALNRVMTRLENEKFKRFCQERGFKGDMGDKDVVEYDIFM